MKQFEYKKEELIGTQDLTYLGIDGWELVAIYNSVMYFKRELEPKSLSEILDKYEG